MSLWILRNRGTVGRVARSLGFSHGYVRMVLFGNAKSKGLKVENALIDVGAPLIADRIADRLNGAV